MADSTPSEAEPPFTAPRSTPVPITNVSSWTVDAAMQHYHTLRESDIRFETERDRRYSEVKTEQEKAIKIKETADLAALDLARQIQEYKDEKANELREQISSERGIFLTVDNYNARHEELEKRISAQDKLLTTINAERATELRALGTRISISLTAATGVIALVVALVNNAI